MSSNSDSVPPQRPSLLTILRTPSPTFRDKASPQPILRRDSLSSDIETDTSHKPERKELKFAVTVHPNISHPPLRIPSPLQDSDDSEGYEEDEEDGVCSADEVFGVNLPRHQPSNFEPTPIFPPRRARGHIRVLDNKQSPKKCSRHYSPPPRSRSGSETRSRTSDAGPREGRCGSPMPDVSDLPVEDYSPPLPRARRASEHLHGYKHTSPCPPTLIRAEVQGSLSGDDGVYQQLESSLATTLTRARSTKT